MSDKSIEEGKASIYINKELQRVNREILQTLDKKDVLFIFPHTLSNSHTVLVLKKPKTDTSERRVYLPKTVALMAVSYTHLDVYKRQDEKRLASLPDLKRSDVRW